MKRLTRDRRAVSAVIASNWLGKRKVISRITLTLMITCTFAFKSDIQPVMAEGVASLTHIVIHQGGMSYVDLVYGGIARAYVDEPTDVIFTIYYSGEEYGAYLYIMVGATKGDELWVLKDSSVTYKWTWRANAEGEYTVHVELWWNNNGILVLQDSKDIRIVVSKRPSGYDLSIKLIDQTDRPIAGAKVSIEGFGSANTMSTGFVIFHGPPTGIYEVTAIWRSQYNPEPITILTTQITFDRTITITLRTSVYDAELKLVTLSGKTISGAEISLAGVTLGMTDANGKVVAPQVPSKYTETDAAYPVTAMWLGVDVSPAGHVTITASKIYILTATNVATLTVQVVGARGQALSAALVEIKNPAGTTVFNDVTDEQGIVSVEVPYDTYSIVVDYKGFMNTDTFTVNTASPAPFKIATSVFMEIFGQAMTFATFVLWIIVIVIFIAIIVIVIREIRRRQRLKQRIKQVADLHSLLKPICPKCGFSLERRGEVFWCPNCVGWIAPKDAKWV